MPQPKRTISIVLVTGLVGLTLTLCCVGYYLQSQLTKVTHGPRADLVPETRPAIGPDFPLREIDLGYLKVSLPAAIVGKPQGIHGSTWVAVGMDEESGDVTFLQPMDLEESGFNELEAQLSALGAIQTPTWYAMAQAVLRAEPFDLWDIPGMGIQETQSRLQLLILKQGLFTAGHRVRFVETERLNFVVHTLDRYEGIMIDVNDPQKGSLQAITVYANDFLAEQVIDAVAATYALQTDDLSAEAIEARLHQAGIEFPPPPEPPDDDTLTDEEAQNRMNKVADEIRRRRAESDAPFRSVSVPAEND